jgi:hypothetical protein
MSGGRGSLGDEKMQPGTGDKGKDIMRNNMISYRAEHPEGTFNQVSLALANQRALSRHLAGFAIVYRSGI